MSLFASKEIFAADTATIAHASEDAALVVQCDGCIELGDVALVHDEDAVVSYNSLCQVSKIHSNILIRGDLPSTDVRLEQNVSNVSDRDHIFGSTYCTAMSCP